MSETTSIRDLVREKYGALAVRLVAKAHEAGFYRTPAQVARVKEDKKFEPLRPRQDFQQLVVAIERSVSRQP